MTKILTISLLTLFFLAQFGKVISFCYCSVESYRQTGTIDCDCEKNLAGTVKHEANKDHSAAALQTVHFDELFKQRFFTGNIVHPSAIANSIFNNMDESLYNAYLFTMLRPPSA